MRERSRLSHSDSRTRRVRQHDKRQSTQQHGASRHVKIGCVCFLMSLCFVLLFVAQPLSLSRRSTMSAALSTPLRMRAEWQRRRRRSPLRRLKSDDQQPQRATQQTLELERYATDRHQSALSTTIDFLLNVATRYIYLQARSSSCSLSTSSHRDSLFFFFLSSLSLARASCAPGLHLPSPAWPCPVLPAPQASLLMFSVDFFFVVCGGDVATRRRFAR